MLPIIECTLLRDDDFNDRDDHFNDRGLRLVKTVSGVADAKKSFCLKRHGRSRDLRATAIMALVVVYFSGIFDVTFIMSVI